MEKGYGQTLHTHIFTHTNTDVYNSRQEVKTTVRHLFEPIWQRFESSHIYTADESVNK